jgi:hypothetical protein
MKNIEELLEKYWNAETSLEEELELKAYFDSGNVAEQYKGYAALFDYLGNQSTLKADFNPLAKVEQLMEQNQVETVVKREAKIISFASRWRAVAAMLVFALLSLWAVNYFFNPAITTPPEVVSAKKARIIEINDVDEAMAYTEDAMNLISSLLKTGTDQVITGMEKIDNSPVIGSLQ